MHTSLLSTTLLLSALPATALAQGPSRITVPSSAMRGEADALQRTASR